MEDLCPKKRDRYINPHIGNARRHPIHAILWQMGWYDDPKEKIIPPAAFSYPNPASSLDSSKPQAVWMGHSTFLVSYGNFHILTDPIWSRRCSPLPFLGPKRKHIPPVPLDSLPKIDLVLISHNHYDHLDKATVQKLFYKNPETQWLVPHGVKKWFRKLGISNVIELSWWEEIRLHTPIPIKATAVPAQHFSGRGLLDWNRTLWAGWVLEIDKSKTLYFVGDTGYNGVDFKEIGNKWKGIDLSLIPIGCYVPRKFMSGVHTDPQNAVAIHRDVGSKLSIGMHWKTFGLGDELSHLPPYELLLALEKSGLDPETFRALEPGHVINW